MSECDYVVIGGGTAGCIVAGRLSERYRVILLEAGRRSLNPWVQIPLGYARLVDNPTVNWCYETEPELALNSRRLKQPRGKLLGGTGAINGMCYSRGFRSDFDHWRELGNAGWGFEDVLPFFKRNEDNVRGADAYHGAGGPMHVADQCDHRAIGEAFIEAAIRCGYPRNSDFNGAEEEGFGYFQWNYKNGRRRTTADGYLTTPSAKQNLQVVTAATVSRIRFVERRATAVEYTQSAEPRFVAARRGIVLCAGSFNSPQLLQLSGIGDPAKLGRFGIPVIAPVPGVGLNYQDHFTVQMHHRTNFGDTINRRFASPAGRVGMALAYLLRRGGYMAHVGIYGAGFVRSTESVSMPDIEVMCTLWTRRGGTRLIDRFSGFSLMPILLRPKAVGTVALKGPDPSTPPAIRTNFFEDWEDVSAMVRGVRILRRIADTPPLRDYVSDELGPGRAVRSDDDIIAYLRDHAYTGFHPVGTCKMGSDALAVVDARLRVRGVEALHVVDASIMPKITSGHTNAPTMMIGEKGAQMIIEDAAAG